MVGEDGHSGCHGRGAKDIHAAIAFLRGRPDVDSGRIGGIGYSVGGEMMLEAAAGTDALRAVISEGAGIRSGRQANELDSSDKWLSVTVWAAKEITAAPFLEGIYQPWSSRPSLVSNVTCW
ncbi:MAG: dienelactone hydrolase family protein [Aeromicrobium sp.]